MEVDSLDLGNSLALTVKERKKSLTAPIKQLEIEEFLERNSILNSPVPLKKYQTNVINFKNVVGESQTCTSNGSISGISEFSTENIDRAATFDKCKAVKRFATKEFQNNQFKNAMEDRIFHQDSLISTNDALFVVLDGHGSAKVAQMVKNRLPLLFVEALKGNTVQKAMEMAIKEVDIEVLQTLKDSTEDGTTIVMIYIEKQEETVIHVANVGDSEAALVSQDQIKVLTCNHDYSNKDEVDRIKASGGRFLRKKVLGLLAVTRSIGDADLKEFGLISDPYYTRFSTKEGKLLLGSDGVFGKTPYDEILKTILGSKTEEEALESLFALSLKNETHDNISAILIDL